MVPPSPAHASGGLAVAATRCSTGCMTPITEPAVRLAGRDDLAELLRAYDGERTGGPSATEAGTWEAMLATDNLQVYCATVEAELVGTATLLVMPNLTYDCEPTAFIEAVVVRSEWRRRGIATKMVQRALDDARRDGCNKVQLLSHKRHSNDGAHGLYEKLGFDAEAEGFRLYLTEVPSQVAAARTAEA